jgi:hypothetical protein
MTKTLAIGMAMLASLFFAVVAARADEIASVPRDHTVKRIPDADSAFFPRGMIEQWRGERFAMVRIEGMDRFSAERATVEEWMRAHPHNVAALRSVIVSNRALSDAITRRGARTDAIVAARVALNGSLIFYLQ